MVRLTVDCQKLIDELEVVVVEQPVGNSGDDYKIMNGLKPVTLTQDNEQQHSPHDDKIQEDHQKRTLSSH